MKTTERVGQLALYASSCCMDESVFDTDDRFSRCPKCSRLCSWEMVERVVSWQELEEIEEIETQAA